MLLQWLMMLASGLLSVAGQFATIAGSLIIVATPFYTVRAESRAAGRI